MILLVFLEFSLFFGKQIFDPPTLREIGGDFEQGYVMLNVLP